MTEKHWHHLPESEVLHAFPVEVSTGLTVAEVHRRQKESGTNKITTRHGIPGWLTFFRQFHQPLVYILLIACGVTGALGEWVDSLVILAIVLLNASVGFLQESRAETAIQALAQMVAKETTVRREGKTERVPAASLVPGDIVLLQAGDRVPADLRLLAIKNLQVDESSLTGESLPVAKSPEPLPVETILAERKNLAFAGSFITSGTGEGVVCLTGDQTETGRIGQLIAGAEETVTPLTKKIARFSQLVLWVILGLATATFALGVARGEKPVEMFIAAVALAVGAIPEGLPAAVTIVMAIGVSRMAKRQAIIRKLPAVETLGSTTVICSDKTGTLTENQMTVRAVFAGGKLYEFSGTGYEPAGELHLDGNVVTLPEHPALAECLHAGVLCNDSRLVREEGALKVEGDPTEAAMLVAAGKGGLIDSEAHRAAPHVDMIPFESANMFRATLDEAEEGRVIYKVGALEQMLQRCADALDESAATGPLDTESVRRAAEAMAARGLRVLGLARRCMDADHSKIEHANISEGLTFLGLQGMLDPPREAAVAAVRNFTTAGIAVKMITGDHLLTAQVIAEQIGLPGSGEGGKIIAISGAELEAISDADLPEIADRTNVFARVTPAQKLRLVKALQSRSHIVAMTGDGVNDAPALKQADIGVAMGITGTDVAKGAADMILTDDNFTSIEAAVEEGRGVFDNITKFIAWIIPTNLGEALMLLSAIVIGIPLPLLPLQLLWINLTDTLLGLSLAFEPKERDVMTRPPRPPDQALLPLPLILRAGLVSCIMLAGGLGLFLWELRVEQSGLATARTVVLNSIVLVQVFYLFNCRSLSQTPFAIGFFTNRWVLAGSFAMLAAQLLLTYAPVMNRLFHTAPVSAGAWLRITAVAAFTFAAVELEKRVRYRRPKREAQTASATAT